MTGKNKKLIGAIFIIAITLVTGFLWLSLRPVTIIAVHHRSSGFSDVLVNHFPFITKGKIAWWQKNRETLKKRYGVPQPAFAQDFTITFWYFGDGYRERGRYNDRLCFMDMKTQKNCIEKDKAFTVRYSKNSGLYFTTSDGYYYLKENGEIAKRLSD
ncbi:DUF943 family protein [Mixta calida]|uniref:DUF943 family protein n=1 Tax=Mixta calida TaxID=665913 RepID=UPI003CE9C0CD